MGLIARIKESFERAAGVQMRRQPTFPYIAARRRFLNLRFDLHNRCNLRCSICYYSLDAVRRRPAVHMSDEVIDAMERELWPHTEELWLSCGYEPLLAPNLGDVLRRARAAGIPIIRMVTNGLLLGEDKARMLIENGLDGLMVSLDGARKATYEAIRHGSDFDRVIANLRRLQELKRELGATRPYLMANGVMTLANIEEWEELVHLVADLGGVWLTLSPLSVYEELAQPPSLRECPERVNAALERARQAAARRGIVLSAPAGFELGDAAGPGRRMAVPAHCEVPWMSLTILPDGEVLPCYPMSGGTGFGNLRRDGFDAIYYGPALRRLREAFRAGRTPEPCAACALWHNNDLNFDSTYLPHKAMPGQPKET